MHRFHSACTYTRTARLVVLFGRLAAVCLAASSGFAQSTNSQSILGTVQDSSGAVAPNVTVNAVSEGTNLTRTAASNASGNFVISNLPIGFYTVSATAQGFKKFVLEKVQLTVNQEATVNVKLELGSASESVTVQADIVRVETTSGEVSGLITGTQASQIQLNGRNFPQLLQLLPGVSTTFSSGFSLFGGYGVTNNAQSINGSRTDTFSWNLDGADNKDNGGGGNNFVNINPDAIAEFRALTANYGAEYGQNAGAVVNMAVKSGTTEFHGILYEYFRNDAIQARAFNAPTIPKLRYNNFGWNLGGPVYIPKVFNTDKSKLFFFIGGDFKRLLQGVANSWTVPNPAQLSGNFSTLPAAQQPIDPTTGVAFPNGIIPANRFSPNALRLLQNYPAPNFSGSGGNFVFNYVAPLNANQYLYKVDYNISSKNQLNVHYFRDYYTSTQDQTQLIEFNRDIPGTNASVQWTNVPNPTTVNVMQFTFTGNVILEKTGIAPNPLFISDFTRAGEGLTYQTLYNASPAIPTIQVTGFQTLTATPLNFNNFNRIFSFKDDFSKTIGNHNLKTGILLMRSRKNQDNVPAINGNFSFTNSTGSTSTNTGNALGNALLGNFNNYTEASSLREGWYRFTQIEPYIQDDWKVTKRLVLNIGFRWAYMQPQYSALNNTSAFLPQYYNPAQAVQLGTDGSILPNTGNIYNGLVLGGNHFPPDAVLRFPAITYDPAVQGLFHGLPKGTANTDWGTWQPRFGFAYDLTGKQSTVLRGGFGAFYERIEGNYLFSAVNNTPFIQQANIFNGNVESLSTGTAKSFPNTINNSHYLDMKVPRVLNWSLGMEQKLGGASVLSVSYVGSSAANLSYQQDINQLPLGTLTRNPNTNVNALRPYIGYADIFEYNTGANFIYNAAQVQLRKQFKQGGLLNVAYTLSSGRTDANSYSYQPMDSYNLRGDWAASNYNRNQILTVSYVYPLPFWLNAQQWYKRALGGWQVSGVTSIQSGLPFNVTVPGDPAGIGLSNSERPNLINTDWHGSSRTQYLNPASFGIPAAGTFGNLGAFALNYPLYNNWDVSAVKNFPIGERLRVALRAELYNFPNHLSYTAVSAQVDSANFGQVTGATDPRTLQLALRVNF